MVKMYSKRLSDRMRFFNSEMTKYKGVSEQFYLEDMLLYSFMGLSSLFYDLFFNALYWAGLMQAGRPFNVGMLQIGVSLFFTLLLLRKFWQWECLKYETDEFEDGREFS